MVKAKRFTGNTYSRKKPTINIEKKIYKVTVNTFTINHYHVTVNNSSTAGTSTMAKQINQNSYKFGKSSISSEEEAFDKLLKTENYREPNKPPLSKSRNGFMFYDRQEKSSFFNTDNSSSLSSVHLFKDNTKGSTDSESAVRSPPSFYRKNKKLIVKKSQRVKRLKKVGLKKKISKNIFEVAESPQSTIVASSTPTHSNNLKLVCNFTPHFSPIINFCNPKLNCYNSVNELIAIKDNTEQTTKEETLGLSALVAGFGNFGINTPHLNAGDRERKSGCKKILCEISPFQLNIENNKQNFLTFGKQTQNVKKELNFLKDNFENEENINNGLKDNTVKKKEGAEEKENFPGKPLKCQEIDLPVVSLRRSYRTITRKKLVKEDIITNGNDTKQSCMPCKISSPVIIDITQSKSPKSPKDEGDMANDGSKLNLKEDDTVFDQKPALNTVNTEGSHELTSLNVCQESNLVGTMDSVSVNKNLPEDKINHVNNEFDDVCDSNLKRRLSIVPGKKWRRSFIQQRKTGIKTSCPGPSFIANVIKDANISLFLDKSKVLSNSSVASTSLISEMSESFMRRVSLRKSRFSEWKRNDFFDSLRDKLPKESPCKRNQITSVDEEKCKKVEFPEINDCVIETEIEVNSNQRTIKVRFNDNQNEISNHFSKIDLRRKISRLKSISDMEHIAEEISNDLSDAGLNETSEKTKINTSSLSNLLPDESTPKKCVLHEESIFETPPIMKLNAEALLSITKRRKPCMFSGDSIKILNTPSPERLSSKQLPIDKASPEECSNFHQLLNDDALPEKPSSVNQLPNADTIPDYEHNLSTNSEKEMKNNNESSLDLFEGYNSSCEKSVNENMDMSKEVTNEDFYSIDDQELAEIIEEEDVPLCGKIAVLLRCCPQDPLPFEEAFSHEVLAQCKKIGEGVYGEVFMVERPHCKTVVKIIPVEGSQLVNNEKQKTFSEVLSELIITEELSLLRENMQYRTSGYCELKRIMCLTGAYPTQMISLWHEYDKKNVSENECPDKFGVDQLYLALELEHAGEPVESFRFETAKEALSIFLQTLLSLAVAENVLEFEHRDLHIGNILVKPTNEDYISFNFDGEIINVPSYGNKATIIDFTLSRISFKGDVLYCDLNQDPELFMAEGDYQFEIYRLMKNDLDSNWEYFDPKTNIRWLIYLTDKFLTKAKYKNKKVKRHRDNIKTLNQIKVMLEDFPGASECAMYLIESFSPVVKIVKKE